MDITPLDKGTEYVASDGLTYTKLSDRTVRKPCNVCGTKELYWARPVAGGNVIAVGRDGMPHRATCKRSDSNGQYSTVPTPDIPKAYVPPTPPTIPLPEMNGAESDAAILARILNRPSITPEQVRDMVAAGLDATKADILAAAETVLDQVRNGAPRAVEVKWADRATVKIDHAHPQFEKILRLVLERRNVMMVGPKGSGKSTIIRNLATALTQPYHLVTCNAQMTKSDLIGGRTVNGFEPSDTIIHAQQGSVIGFDEYDTLGPHVQTLLNDAISSREIALPSGERDENGLPVPVKFDERTVFVAAANTVGRGATKEYNARSKQDDASIDRFILIRVDYDERLENYLLAATGAPMEQQVKAAKAVRELRRAAADLSLPYGWGVRAMVDIVIAIRCGLSHDEIVYGRLSRGMADNDWMQLTRQVKLPVFV